MASPACAVRVRVTGIVQGVGFRPFVHRLATGLGLDGRVGNDASGVFVDVVGPESAVDELVARLATDAPPLARVDDVAVTSSVVRPARGFRIVESRDSSGERTLVPPDTAICDACVREMLDPADRRHRHPFITCTDCGPRFTIIRDLPYDRPNTTMAGFEMCAACAAEYDDPTDRRYHAQPIACHDCGPTLRLVGADGEPADGDPVDAAARRLLAGETVAVKGLGGYHLVVDATDGGAVDRLRARKHRPDKSLAVMVADLAAVGRLAEVGDGEVDLLTSPARPIVLLRARPDTPIAAGVAPGNPLVGVMLPYTAIHHLLVAAVGRPLVMTSGNRSGEPIAHDDDDAAARLADLCDAFLTHDRPIHVPCDDSVVRVVGGHPLPIRRARGFAPVPVDFRDGRRPVVAAGGELKSTCCVASTRRAWVSQHIGDMADLETASAFEATVERFERFYEVEPAAVAVDPHPGYLASRWGRRRAGDRPVLEVQHHHAHLAAVMAEHGLDPHRAVLGIAFDGTGYGDDGTIWGGEALRVDVDGYERVAHLAPIPLPGGDAAIRHPSRVALAYLHAAGVDWTDDLPPVGAVAPQDRANLAVQLERNVACVPASSMGRLFDAVASLIGLRHRISYEAQAAIELEIAASRSAAVSPTDAGDRRFVFDGEVAEHRDLWRAMVADLRAGRPIGEIADAFHHAVVDLVVAVAVRHAVPGEPVLLSGGAFQNALLVERAVAALGAAGFVPLTHRLVPPNDGGLSLGQAFVAAHTIRLDPARSASRSASRPGGEET